MRQVPYLKLVPPIQERPKVVKVKRINSVDLARLQAAGFVVVIV